MHARIAETSASFLDADGGEVAIATAAAAAFDTLLISDADRLARPLASVAADAASRGLATWVALSPDARGAVRFDAHAAPRLDPWLYDGDAALDPRRPPHTLRLGPVASSDVLVDDWTGRLSAAVADGVSGFVCRDPDRLPPAFWTRLFAAIRPAATEDRPIRWIAWTAGLAPDAVAALIAAGFETVVASLAWWDGRARWLADELERAGDARRLAFAADPYALDDRSQRDDSLTDAQRTAVASLVADALLVPEASWRDGDVAALAAIHRAYSARGPRRAHLRFATGPDAPLTALVATPHADLRASDSALVAVLNPDRQRRASLDASNVTTLLSGFGDYREIGASTDRAVLDACTPLALPGGGVRLFEARRLAPIRLPIASPRRSAEAALEKPRLSIEAITPTVDGGRFPAKRTAGESVRVEADLLIDGHEKLAAALLYRAVGDRDWREVPMEPVVNDRWTARFPLHRMGRHEFTIEAWRDVFGNFRYELEKKSQAGLDVSLELIEGRRLVERAVTDSKTQRRPDVTKRLSTLAATLGANPAAADKVPGEQRDVDRGAMAAAVALLLSSQTLADMRRADRREFATRPDVTFPVDAERSGASFAAWYELFPRSLGNAPGAPATHHGTFDDVIERLPAVKAMGFDVLYFPPINPIGKRNRKGKNNSLTAHEGEPGSPYAIGSADGGHDAIHPQLGTFDDFRRLRDAAIEHGLELALDFAIQCSPDHPWLKDHPGWFAWRPDGSLRYAENPPKKYEDIVNVEFYGNEAASAGRHDTPAALWSALRDVVLLWCGEGVRIFRVDNPHTKPLPFWEWMIGEVRAKYPDTIFLAEAFTRPKLMYRLAKLGYSQSYTYFTWRHTKAEFTEYLTELTSDARFPGAAASPKDFFRPHFFVNTPDINPVFLQRSGRPGFLIRAALAATLSGLWGVYSGFELCEATPVPGKEEYLDSEKYEIRAWDWQRPGNIIAEITQLNRLRNENPALRTHLNVRFRDVFDPNILLYEKATEDRSNVLLVAVNLDPYGVHEADFELPLWDWGLPDDAGVAATDLIDGHRFRWEGKRQRVRLDPNVNPYAIWRVAS